MRKILAIILLIVLAIVFIPRLILVLLIYLGLWAEWANEIVKETAKILINEVMRFGRSEG